MKYIFQGIKDYCKDWWHDWLLEHLFRFYKKCVIFFIPDKTGARQDLAFWKEGNLRHYIQQRKAVKLLKEIKTLQKELKQKADQ